MSDTLDRDNQVHRTLEDAVRAVLKVGDNAFVSDKDLAKAKVEPRQMALNLGCYMDRDLANNRYVFKPGD